MQAARSREGSLSCTFCAHEQQRRRGLDLGIVVALFGKPVCEKAAKALQLHDQLMPRQGPLTPRALGFFGWRREQMPWQRLCAQRALVSGTTATTPVGRHGHAVSHAVTQLSVQLAADCGCVSRQIERDLTWIS